jgi:hypothetical protein
MNINRTQVIGPRIPDGLIQALTDRRGKHTEMTGIHLLSWLNDDDAYVGVAGDSANASYEGFTFIDGKLECPDEGFGTVAGAMRATLNKIDA